jgi:hypothetical protein
MALDNYNVTSIPPVPPVFSQLDKFVRQRDEWQAFTCSKLMPVVERVLRDFYDGALLASKERGHGTRDVDAMFRKIIKRVPYWSDEECARELSEPTADIDACIRMAVRAHATVMALTIDKACKQTIKVPNACSFFRRILVECALDHTPSLFATKEPSARKEMRRWISDCIKRHLLDLVPINLFTCENVVASVSVPEVVPPPLALPTPVEVPASPIVPVAAAAVPAPAAVEEPKPVQMQPEAIVCEHGSCEIVPLADASTPVGPEEAAKIIKGVEPEAEKKPEVVVEPPAPVEVKLGETAVIPLPAPAAKEEEKVKIEDEEEEEEGEGDGEVEDAPDSKFV